MWYRFGVFTSVLLSLLTGCTAPPAPATSSAWQPALTVGRAEQNAAPAIHATAQQVTLSWIASSAAGVHHDVVARQNGQITPPVTLPLPPTAPRDSQLIPAAGDRNHHLLWIDLDDTNTPQLYTAVIDRTLGIFRGAVPVSQHGARCYALFSNPDGSAWAFWQDTTRPATLYSAHIDPSGRVLRRQPLTTANGCPATTDTGNARYVFWQQDNHVYLTRFTNGTLQSTRPIVQAPSRATGDRFHRLQAANTGQHLYIIWNITRADGHPESWFTRGTPSTDWAPPRRLTFITDPATRFETTYNTGPAVAAQLGLGGQQAAWVNPLPSTGPVLPLATQIDGDTLGIVYVSDADIVGYQPLARTNGLVGVPRLRADRDRFLYLTWSDPLDIGTAELRLLTTRPRSKP